MVFPAGLLRGGRNEANFPPFFFFFLFLFFSFFRGLLMTERGGGKFSCIIPLFENIALHFLYFFFFFCFF